jgi:hypothetical protein
LAAPTVFLPARSSKNTLAAVMLQGCYYFVKTK